MERICSGECGLVAPIYGLKRYVNPFRTPSSGRLCSVCCAEESKWATNKSLPSTLGDYYQRRLAESRTMADVMPPRVLGCGHVCRRQTDFSGLPSLPFMPPFMMSQYTLPFASSIEDRCCGCTRRSLLCSECLPRTLHGQFQGMGIPTALSNKLARVVLRDFAGEEVEVSGEEADTRQRRLKQNIQFLYHQTDSHSAHLIIDSQTFKPGTEGLAGGGIYFAVSASDTEHKAHKKGTIMRARVMLGNVFEIPPFGDQSITFQKLVGLGYDSVRIPRPGGTEYVVYCSDQVDQITYYSGVRP